MPEQRDCRTVEAILQRVIVGAPVPETELDAALAHVASCDRCSLRFEEAIPSPSHRRKGKLRAGAEIPVEPERLFERALTAALASPEPIVRLRAANRLGQLTQVGAAAAAALAAAAAADPDRDARAAALAALGQLDDEAPLLERLLEAWAAAPAAAQELVDALGRLTAGPGEAFARLAQAVVPISGEIVVVEDELRLHAEGLDPELEGAKPIVALPAALADDPPAIEWRGKAPGLVEVETSITGRRLDVRLGNLLSAGTQRLKVDPLKPQELFQHVYLLRREHL